MMIRSVAFLLGMVASTVGARPLPRDVGADYALSTCLTQTAAGSLREEGYRLGSIVIAQSGRSPLAFGKVGEAVAREAKRRPMATVHGDGPVAESDHPAVLAHCLAVSRSPAVRAALAKLR